jgi:altronate dehydratase
MSYRWPSKDKDEILSYSVDWSRLLKTKTISSVVWKISDANGEKVEVDDTDVVNGLQRVSATNTNTVATIVLGLGTNNFEYKVHCSITDSDGSIIERSVKLRIKEQ